MNKNIFLLFVLMSLLPVNSNSSVQREGVEGQVYWVEGNQMPGVGEDLKGRRVPLKRTLYFFEAVKHNNAKGNGNIYNIIVGKLVKKVKTGKDGFFSIKLDPGKYSVFVKEHNGWFASTMDDEHISQVIVQEGVYTEMVIEVNYKAYY